jgi:ABC-type phosphate transport system substrate-binding protein
MNDEFLYELRSSPSRAFAVQLKARLDIQASDAARQRRAFKWFTVGAVFMGSVALAFLSPAVREGATSIVVQFSAAPTPESQVRPNPKAARVQSGGTATAQVRSSASSSVLSNDAPEADAAGSSRVDANGHHIVERPRSSAAGSLGIAGAQQALTARIGYSQQLKALGERLISDLESLATVRVDGVHLGASADPCARDFDPTIDVIVSDRRLATDRQISCGVFAPRYVELPFAYDAVVIITNADNTWARRLSRDDFRKLRESHASNPLTTWSQVRAEWPTLPIALVGTAFESSLGSRFADAVGLAHGPSIFTPTADDIATLRAVENNFGALGYIDFGTYRAAMQTRTGWPTAAAFVNAQGEAITPTVEAIQSRKYELSRPIYLYFKVVPERRVVIFTVLDQLFRRSESAVREAGYVGLAAEEHAVAIRTIRKSRYGVDR